MDSAPGPAITRSPQDTDPLFDAAMACSNELDAIGRTLKNTIFLSAYTPALEVDIPLPPKISRRQYRSRTATGIPTLEEAFAKWLAHEGILPYPGQSLICKTSAMSDVLPHILDTDKKVRLFNRGDKVLICTPIFSLLPMNVQDKGLTAAAIPGHKKNGYKPTAKNIAAALASPEHRDARLLMLVNPSNPGGLALSRAEIDAIADVVVDHNRPLPPHQKLIVLVDETFQNMMWDRMHITSNETFSHFAENKKLHNCTITLGSFSKDLGPGIGFAYAFGSSELISCGKPIDGTGTRTQQEGAIVFNSDAAAGWSSIEGARQLNLSIYASALDALNVGLQDKINPALKKAFGGRQDFITVPHAPEGGFHAFVDFSGLKGFRLPNGTEIKTSMDVARALMEQQGVVIYPGEMFMVNGEDMMMRLSLNLETGKLAEGLDRIERFCLSLTKPLERTNFPLAPQEDTRWNRLLRSSLNGSTSPAL